MTREEIIEKLTKFKLVNKYEAFYEILPEVRYTPYEQQVVVNSILNNCCKNILNLFEQNDRKITKTSIKKIIFQTMDELALAAIDDANREFAYQLGWFIADKTGVDLRKGSAKKNWGYWKVEAPDEVKAVGLPRKKIIKNASGKSSESKDIIYPI